MLVLLVAGGGAAWVWFDRDGDDDRSGGDAPSADTSPSPSKADTSPTGPPSPSGPSASSDDPSGGPDGGPDTDPATPKLRSYLQAASFRDDWEFLWEGNEFNARFVVSRDHFDCREIAADDRLGELGCTRAVSATYVNERDQVTLTHFFLKFGDRGLSRKDAGAIAQDVSQRKDLDALLKLEGDAVWEGWEQGGWRASRVDGVVIFTGATGSAEADIETVNDYLRWAHTDFTQALRIRRAF